MMIDHANRDIFRTNASESYLKPSSKLETELKVGGIVSTGMEIPGKIIQSSEFLCQELFRKVMQ